MMNAGFRALTLVLLTTAALADEASLKQEIEDLRKIAIQLESQYADLKKRRLEDPEPPAYDAAIAAAVGVNTLEWQAALTHAWLIICGALVMLMQAGFAMVEAGTCRARNVQNILMKNLVDVCAGTIAWWAIGYSLAYGWSEKNESAFAGDTNFFGGDFLKYDDKEMMWKGAFNCDYGTGPGSCQLNWFFQWAFCATAATIVSGGVAERVQMIAYGIYTIFITAIIYPVVVGWTWSLNGWLNAKGADGWQKDKFINDVGFMDFAGSGVVHMAGGVGALVGAACAGPRKGRFDGTASAEEFDAHSLPLVVLGTFLLWFGWYGFNCGSTLMMDGLVTGVLAAHVAMTTTISAATGGLGVLGIRFAITRKYDIGGMCNGILAGLVSITAPCGTVESGSAFLIGLLGAGVYEGASRLLKLVKVDDPIDAFAVHGACGAWGVFAAAIFDWGKDFDYAAGWNTFSCYKDLEDDSKCLSGGWGQLFAANIAEIFAIAAWVAGLSLAVFLPMRLGGLLRADDAMQDSGADAIKHSPAKAYSIGESSV